MKRKQAMPPDPAESNESSDKRIWTPANKKLTISSLPEDVVANILVRLPLKSLLPLKKSSSSRIRNLIRSPHFVAAHADRHSANSGLFVLGGLMSQDVAWFLPPEEIFNKRNSDDIDNDNLIQTFSLPKLDAPQTCARPECVGSCNGLVCLVIDSLQMLLWNPATSDYGFTLIERRLRSGIEGREIFGFGHDSVSGDYKSVRISVWKDGTVMCQVFSWEKRTWTELEESDGILQDTVNRNVFDLAEGCLGPGVTTPGRVTWIMEQHDRRVCGPGMVLSFRLDTEKFESPKPDGDRSSSWLVERDVCIWKGSVDAERRKVPGLPVVGLSLVDGDFCNWSKVFALRGCRYINDPITLSPTAIWSCGGDGDRRSAVLKHWTGLARDSKCKGKMFLLPFIEVIRAFEFAETLAPIPGSNRFCQMI